MKAVNINAFFDPSSPTDLNQAMSMRTQAVPACKPGQLLVQVLACSISPGDATMVRGNLIFLRQPFPFVPGMDICGRVVDSNSSSQFTVGDIIVASNGMSATGGMAEYMAVDEGEAVLKPPAVGFEVAASSSSAITARNAVMDHVHAGDRVLILGGSGGVGLAAIQIAKRHAKASFVATTSTQEDLCKTAGANVVLNYRRYNWWEHPWGKKFDVIVDTGGGGNFDGKAHRVLKMNNEGGEFVAVTGDDPKPDVTSWWKVLPFAWSMMKRPLVTRLFPGRYPKYTGLMPYNVPEGRAEVLGWMANGQLEVALDPTCPLPFTEEGLREAFRVVASGHAHGKVVVTMMDEKTEADDMEAAA